ncbi:MAG: hydantoinase B/oxoprolinase family protein, partial [Myxococcota bacterium]
RRHVWQLSQALPGSHLRFMQSSGGLTRADRFRGPNALLSGPAGGVVAAARVAARAGFDRAISFDMGGTSTDVSLIVDGEVERSFETKVGGVRVRAPMLRIHTVAAGGGSICRFDGFRLTVGPESAGSDPGPLCYGLEDDSGVPLAVELSLTDVNLVLGRVQKDRFPFPVSEARAHEVIEAQVEQVRAAGFDLDADALAAGFVEIANANMAQAIAQVSVARGVDPRGHVLVGFGGAGGQHVCGIARRLGIRTILLHPLAGLLSAYGIGVADVTWDGQRDGGRTKLPDAGLPDAISDMLSALAAEGRSALQAEGLDPARIGLEFSLDLRYDGTESALSIRQPEGDDGRWRAAFEAEHEKRFGYLRPERAVEIVTARVRAVVEAIATPPPRVDGRGEGFALSPVRQASVHFGPDGRSETPVYLREDLPAGVVLSGPALILEATGTVVLDPGFELEVDTEGVFRLEDKRLAREVPASNEGDLEHADPIRLEVFGNRFMSMAEQMGAVLRNTAVSTNIMERLDYSCAVFDGSGGLVANAPHIPVHLGAMGATVRVVLAGFPDLSPGDVVATNDPFAGGSHLPDVTVVTPVFLEASRVPDFFVACRGHHADLGGTTPGSMPPDSTRLDQEGVIIAPFRLVRAGRFDEERIRRLLTESRFPARRPDDNIADLVAMVAANRAGEQLLCAFVQEQGARAVVLTMRQLQQASAQKVAREIGKLADGAHRFDDQMDDGTPVRVRVDVRGDRMHVDFSGTGAAVAHNLNAPPAVVQAALIYVLRSLVEEPIPLNGGCLDPVSLVIPPGSLLDPPPGSAVVGGNVETSQRIVDVLLGALGRAAASQGTMNNVTFGNDRFGYYETIGGGAGAGPSYAGASGIHTHMTNTRITDPEVLEVRYPVRLERFALRTGSGGEGLHRGGDGLVREYRFLQSVTLSLLTERRCVPPWGLEGGGAGCAGRNRLRRVGGEWETLPGRCTRELNAGDLLSVETPGGGGMGRSE